MEARVHEWKETETPYCWLRCTSSSDGACRESVGKFSGQRQLSLHYLYGKEGARGQNQQLCIGIGLLCDFPAPQLVFISTLKFISPFPPPPRPLLIVPPIGLDSRALCITLPKTNRSAPACVIPPIPPRFRVAVSPCALMVFSKGQFLVSRRGCRCRSRVCLEWTWSSNAND